MEGAAAPRTPEPSEPTAELRALPRPQPQSRLPARSRARLRVLCDTALDRQATRLFEEFRADEAPETFRRLFEIAGPALLPLVRMKVRRARAAIDPAELMTDTFELIYRHRRTFRDRGPGSFVKWCLAIAGNLLRQEVRATTRRVRREQGAARSIEDRGTDPAVQVIAAENDKEIRLTYRELRRVVLAAMRELPAPLEQALLLHAQERLSYAEVAARLGIRPGAVSMRIKRARERILANLCELAAGARTPPAHGSTTHE
jgi:RNA polymerase sigma-70 factor (ECF subfamily)